MHNTYNFEHCLVLIVIHVMMAGMLEIKNITFFSRLFNPVFPREIFQNQ
jgi:hypothetical protein